MQWGLPLVWKHFLNRGGKVLYVPQSGAPHIAFPNHPKPKRDSLRFVCISDLHGKQNDLEVPSGDVLLVSGDLLDVYSPVNQIQQLKTFNKWLGGLPHRYKIIVAGNHDKCCEDLRTDGVQKILTNATYLQDSETTVEGVRIYGAPYSIIGESDNRAFQFPRGAKELKERWDLIPEVDVLITHTPPKGFHDEGEGCEHLTEAVMQKKPKYHIFGHYHTTHGVSAYHHGNNLYTTFVNAASLSEGYYPIQRAIVFDLGLDRKEGLPLSSYRS